ncbi:hypothetical protein CRG98_027490 [Punica granatum]|uniref:Retrotransposon Copia-like N-terminal domain-containing protein n=1 Tax=Punica granatum TaxID=22663 RepID=A0A2I0J767_PUNGR|nr:hypothetical protein CRG98_027490 [Punica granatum]
MRFFGFLLPQPHPFTAQIIASTATASHCHATLIQLNRNSSWHQSGRSCGHRLLHPINSSSSHSSTMTEDNQNPSASASIPAALVLNQSDNPRTQLISCHLNGQNYITWSNAMLIALQAKTKLGFIDGTVKKPDESDPLYEQWVTYNSMLVLSIIMSYTSSWLILLQSRGWKPLSKTFPTVAYSAVPQPRGKTCAAVLTAAKQGGYSHQQFNTSNGGGPKPRYNSPSITSFSIGQAYESGQRQQWNPKKAQTSNSKGSASVQQRAQPSSAHSAQASSSSSSPLSSLERLSDEQLEHLLSLARTHNPKSEPLSDKDFISINSRADWIIDSGASSGIVLHHVLFMPDFKCYLISMVRLSMDYGFGVYYNVGLCLIRDPIQRKTIRVGELQREFWILHRDAASSMRTLLAGTNYDSELLAHATGAPVTVD